LVSGKEEEEEDGLSLSADLFSFFFGDFADLFS